MEIVISGRGAKLDITTGPSMCVISVPRNYEQNTVRDTEVIDDMVNEWAHLLPTANKGEEEKEEEKEEVKESFVEFDEDFDDDE